MDSIESLLYGIFNSANFQRDVITAANLIVSAFPPLTLIMMMMISIVVLLRIKGIL